MKKVRMPQKFQIDTCCVYTFNAIIQAEKSADAAKIS